MALNVARDPGMSSACNILIVDDDPLCRRGLERGLRLDKHQVLTAGSVAEARVMLAERGADVAFLDFNLGDGTGAELLRWARSKGLIRAAFCVTGMPTCANVVDAMQAGFIDVVEKPYDLERIRALVRAWGPRPVTDLDGWRARYAPGIIGHAPALLEALQVIEGIADTDCGSPHHRRERHRQGAARARPSTGPRRAPIGPSAR